MMDFDANVASLQLAYWTTLKAGGPILLIALTVGLVVGLLQAATSINEATLAFVPKLGIVLAAMAITSASLLTTLGDYFRLVFETIATLR